jgi:hypothetical protein
MSILLFFLPFSSFSPLPFYSFIPKIEISMNLGEVGGFIPLAPL